MTNILDAKTQKNLGTINDAKTVGELKKQFLKIRPNLYVERLSFRDEPRGRALPDNKPLADVTKLYFKDLGPQVGWTTVFLTEYLGPLVIYLIFFMRPSFIYEEKAPMETVVYLACACWTFHYAKRLYETVYIHRFSNATMSWTNIVKNSLYYWGFAAFVAYFVNHPLYTPAILGWPQVIFGLSLFVINEIGNLSIHIAFRDLRPPGTKERKIPMPSSNPFTELFEFVSCPNYTFEVGSWIGFTILTQSLASLLFTVVGAYQMTVWAIGKHKRYRREFTNYPRGRRAILPFFI